MTTMTADQLRALPCLWCASESVDNVYDDKKDFYYEECNSCGATGPRCDSFAQAISEWNTRPTAVASHAEGEVDDPKTDREALVYLMRAFDTESWQCPRCGHDEDCATMDSAYFLRDYLASHPPRSGDEARDALLAEMERRVEVLDDSETQLIKERDAAEDALSDMFARVTGRAPEWSNVWGFEDAVDEAEEHVAAIEQDAARLEWLWDQLREYDKYWYVPKYKVNNMREAIDAAMAARGEDK